jgi:hypothetical protein
MPALLRGVLEERRRSPNGKRSPTTNGVDGLRRDRICGVRIMATMTPGRWINLAAVVLGALGALVLYKGSFAFESFGQWHDAASIKAQSARNLRRQTMQRVGLGLICASFVLQGVALFFD